MNKYTLISLILFIVAIIVMMFFNKPFLAIGIAAVSFVFIMIIAAKHEKRIDELYKTSQVSMCSEGVIRHVRLHK